MKIDKRYILETIIKENNTYNNAILKNIIIPKDYLWCKSKVEYIEAILYDLKKAPTCSVCNKSIKYNKKLKYYPKYDKYCSDFCKTKEEIKNIQLTKEFIEDYFIRKDGNYNVHRTKVIEIPKEYSWCKSKSEYLDCVRYDIKEVPKCKNCNQPVKYLNSSKNKIKYQNFCSITCVNKYEGTKNKIKNTNIEKYGKEYYTQTDEYLNKIKNTNIEKYGCESTNQKHIKNISEFNDIDFNSLQKWIKNNTFLIDDFMKYFNVTRKTVNDLKNKFNIKVPNKQNKSKTQKHIYKLLNKFTNDISYNDKNVIKTEDKEKIELDIVIPEYNFAIEYDGLIYHSFGLSKNYSVLNNAQKERNIYSSKNKNIFNKNYTNKDIHLLKTELSEKENIQLFHIFENEWINKEKRKIWFSILLSKMNKTRRIFARKCQIRDLSDKKYHSLLKEFQNKNHIQGFHNSKVKIGLFFENELVSLMTFGKTRYNKEYEWELIRFCSKINITIIGGASKLLKFFEINYNPLSLISYANRRWSTGNVYQKLGFEFLQKTEPNFFYFNPFELKYNYFKLESREQYQKYKLKEYFDKGKINFYDENLSGHIIMFKNGYRRIWDSGNLVFIKRYI